MDRKVFESELELEELPKLEKKDGMYDECEICIGTGWIHLGLAKVDRKPLHVYSTCMRCKGQGYVDWTQNVMKTKGPLI